MGAMSQRCDRDIVFASRPGGDLLLDLHRPAAGAVAGAPLPLIIWLHGGGWFTGDRTLAPDLPAHAEAMGAAIASIEYRLSGEAIFPAQIIDLRAAIRFLRERAPELGLDAARFGLWGSSAGAHLAALAGVTGHLPRWEGEPAEAADVDVSVQAVMAAYPPVDLARCVSDALVARPDADPRALPESRVLGGLPEERPALAASAGPLSHIGAGAGPIPPFQVAHGTADVAVRPAHSVMLHRALSRAGAVSELFLLDGYKHGFLNPGGRMEAGLSAVMDDGRLDAEGPAPARRIDVAGNKRDARFGFETIHAFFRAALAPR